MWRFKSSQYGTLIGEAESIIGFIKKIEWERLTNNFVDWEIVWVVEQKENQIKDNGLPYWRCLCSIESNRVDENVDRLND